VDALTSRPELFVPAYQRTFPGGRTPFQEWGSSWFYLFGRLQDGVGLPAAEAAMESVTASLRSAWDGNGTIRVLLAPGVGLTPEERAEGRRVGWLLSGIATLVLLLTCANVGNLFLARATERVGEVSVRQALGAGRGRLVRQLVTESVVLALVATALAVPLVLMAGGLLPGLLPWRLSVSLAPDARVFAFMAVVGVLAGLLFGALPSLAVARRDVAHTLREGGTTGGRRRTRLRDALVVGQLALSLGLLSGAALLARSVLNARAADPGFVADAVVVGFLNAGASGRYDSENLADLDERLVAQLKETPGVVAAAVAGQAPIVGGHSRSTVVPADRADDRNAGFEAEYIVVTPDYFSTLRIPLLQGRTFREAAQESEPVVVVNEALARLFWPGEDAVGKELSDGDRPLRVIGVVGDVQMRSLRAPANPGVYYPYHQVPESYLVIHVRTQGPATAAIPALKRAVALVDPELPLSRITDLREGISQSLAETRTFVSIVTTFAGLALILAVIGLYGLVAHGVSQRAREMGIRLALGAGSGELHRLILTRAAVLAGAGVVLGLGVAVALGRALEGALFGVSASNPLALGGAALLLLGASLVAAWVPARRASRVDAAVSLRE
jgi:predicted permease